MSSVHNNLSRPRNVSNVPRPPREQKYAPSTHLYYQGRLANFYINWQGKTQLIIIPHQKCYKLTEFYPLDLGYLFQEIYSVMEQKRVMNFTLHVFKRDWDVAPHLFIKIGMAQDLYNQFVAVPHISAGFVPPITSSPPPPPPPVPPVQTLQDSSTLPDSSSIPPTSESSDSTNASE